MLQDFNHDILRKSASDIEEDGVFSVIVDGTQDINGTEQESIYVRHVDDDLNLHEDFVGLDEAPSCFSTAAPMSLIYDAECCDRNTPGTVREALAMDTGVTCALFKIWEI